MKKILFLVLLIVGSQTIHAQTFHWAGIASGHECTNPKVQCDKSGNVIAIGNLNIQGVDSFDMDFGPGIFKIAPAMFKTNSFIAKYTPSGELLWAKILYSQNCNNRITDIQIDTNNQIIFTGTFDGLMDFDPGPAVFNMNVDANSIQLFVEKIDSNGNFLWAKTLSNSNGALPNSPLLKVDKKNELLIYGNFTGTIDFDPGPAIYNLTTNQNNVSNTFILKLSSSGLFSFAKQIKSNNNNTVEDLEIDHNNNIIFTGSFNDSIDADPGIGINMLTTNANPAIFIIKLDTLGQYIFAKRIQNSAANGQLLVKSIQVDLANNIYYAGNFSDSINFSFGPINDFHFSNGLDDNYISKISSQGNYLWTKTFGNGNSDQVIQIVTKSENYFYILGKCSGTVDFDPGPGIYNLNALPVTSFISKFDTSSVFIETLLFGGVNGAGALLGKNFTHIQQYFYLTGTAQGTNDFNPGVGVYNLTTQNPFGNHFFIDKFSFCGTHYDTTIHACNTINLWGTNYDSSKHFVQSFQSASECDSSINVNLVMQYGPTDTIQQTVCKNFTINNVTYNSSGVYVQHFPIGAACDSLLIIDLQVTNPGNLTISQIQDTLRVTPTNYTYQWIDCATNLPINAANDTIFVPASSGTYKVVAYFAAGCSDTSSCKTVGKNVGLNEQPIQYIKIYPNPTSESFTISTEGVNHDFKLTITDLLGKILFEQKISPKQNQTISLANFANGAYFIRLENEKINFVEKIIKTNK